jgi:hypothetical protein
MGGGKGGSAPTPPDYSKLVGQQGQVNYGQWLNQIYAGRPDQSNPYGYTQWSPPPMPLQGTTAAAASGGQQTTQPVGAAGGGSPDALGGAPPAGGGFLTGFGGGATDLMQHAATARGGSNVNPGAGLMYGGAIPAPTGQWNQTSGFSPAVAGAVNPMLANAGAAASSFNAGNNPTWQGPSAGMANVGYGGPSSAGNLAFNPAGTAQGLYQGQMALLEPGMQAQAAALDQSLKAQGYDVNQPGGAQTAENNLQNQQNLQRAQAAGWATGQAIPQGAMALGAQESIPQVQQQIAQGYQAGLLNPLMTGANIGAQQFQAGIAGQQLPGQEANQFLSGALSPAGAIPGGAAQVPGMAGLDIMGPAQQGYANAMSGYNANQANQANFMNGLMSLGGNAAMLAFL